MTIQYTYFRDNLKSKLQKQIGKLLIWIETPAFVKKIIEYLILELKLIIPIFSFVDG